jgi:hypothetical protein
MGLFVFGACSLSRTTSPLLSPSWAHVGADGELISARAIATRRCSPRDKPSGSASARFDSSAKVEWA